MPRCSDTEKCEHSIPWIGALQMFGREMEGPERGLNSIDPRTLAVAMDAFARRISVQWSGLEEQVSKAHMPC